MPDREAQTAWSAISYERVDPRLVEATRGMVNRVGPELGLDRVTVTFVVRADSLPEAERVGTVFTSASETLHGAAVDAAAITPDWPPEPTIFLVPGAYQPNDVLHELRHLWQSRTGFRGDQAAREADAHGWADERIRELEGPWRRRSSSRHHLEGRPNQRPPE